MEFEDYQHRVIAEAVDLEIRLNALRSFFASAVFLAVSDFEKSLLHDQHEAMLKYLRVLQMRIGTFVLNNERKST